MVGLGLPSKSVLDDNVGFDRSGRLKLAGGAAGDSSVWESDLDSCDEGCGNKRLVLGGTSWKLGVGGWGFGRNGNL